ncbi:SMC-Scp complex subunit ScpB [Gilvimarinus agarilyticus]|uniref:SMC-Scp complex subunit ScpB n=1 Tax=Gilvimarinus agarilyticus TaxID=679259 RepID=UPI0009FC7BD3|nr:SMC-Scp complex subunit ScpB [Gilvimarinus agarilyticus]
MIATEQLQAIVEGALMASSEPLSVKRLMSLFEEDDTPDSAAFEAALSAIAEACEGRGFELKQVASGWRIQVREELAPWINRLWEEKPQKYSRALLETLALIAYRQPITRGDIEEIRGVAVSSHIIKTLVERDWVKVVGQRDVPGRPSLYATTRDFLDYFNLKSLDELPTLSEIRDLDELNAELDLGAALTATSGGDNPEQAVATDQAMEQGDNELDPAGDDDPEAALASDDDALVAAATFESDVYEQDATAIQVTAEAGDASEGSDETDFDESEADELLIDEAPSDPAVESEAATTDDDSDATAEFIDTQERDRED